MYSYTSLRDATYLITRDQPHSVYCFDLPRSRPSDVSFEEICCIVEGLKNGVIVATKYRPLKRLQNPALVILFSNY